MPTKKPLKMQASSISRIIKCPGSMTLESKLPDRLRYFAYKDAAAYGTLCHAWGEIELKRYFSPKKKIEDAELDAKIDAHPRAEEIRYIGSEYAARVYDLKPRGKFEIRIEEKFRATIHGVDCVAKSDAFYVTKDGVIKCDLKSGNFDYAESAGKQMWFAGNLWHDKNLSPDGARMQSYTIQPAYFSEARRVVASPVTAYNREDFGSFVYGITKRQKEFNPGEHCKMCAAILTCKKVKNLVEEFFEMAKKPTKEIKNFKEIYLKKGAVLAFLDAVDAHLFNEMSKGRSAPGLYLEEYNGHRRWTDAGEAAEKLAEFGNKIYKPRELKTPAQVEKIAGKENIAGLYTTPKLRRVAVRENNFESFEG